MPDLPPNEYESYAPGVLLLLRDGADDRRIATYLSRIERNSMGLRASQPERVLVLVPAIREAAQVPVEPEP